MPRVGTEIEELSFGRVDSQTSLRSTSLKCGDLRIFRERGECRIDLWGSLSKRVAFGVDDGLALKRLNCAGI
jgi:hypothetical protein